MAVLQSYHPSVAEAPADLNRIADAVEVSFAQLSEEVQRQVPDSFSRPGRTKVGASSVFVYRTFHIPHTPEIEPVVVGIALEPRDSETIIRGDVSGEESGTVYFELTQHRVDSSHTAVMATALEFASELAQKADVVVNALVTPAGG